MMILTSHFFISARFAIVASLLLLGSAQAQTLPDNATALEAVTVSGEKVERTVFDTASSVSVIGAQQIQQNAGKSDLKELINTRANVFASSPVGAPIIRGQDTQGPNYGAGAFFGGTVPRAGINIDGRMGDYNELYFGHNGSWDVEQIEVFRGPQTTSQGANSIAGAIVVKTKDPTFTPEFGAQTLYGSRNKKSLGLMASGSLLANELAGRIALDYAKRDTFVRFVNPKFSPGPAQTEIEHATIRAKLLYLPAAVPELEAKLTISHNRSEGPQQQIVNAPFDLRNNVATSLVSQPINSTAVIADIQYDTGEKSYWHNQLQWSKSHNQRLNNPMTNGSANVHKDDISNESRWHFSGAQQRLSGFIGLFLRRNQSDQLLRLRGSTVFADEKKQAGLFAELNWKLHQKWSLTTAVRYQYDHINRRGSTPFVPGKQLNYERSFDAVLPKIALSYQPGEDWLVGISAVKGYNPGGVGLSFKRQKFVSFDKETVWNYELFSRAELLDKRLGFNANIFYSDFRNAQRNVVSTVPGASHLVEALSVNAEKAHAYGMELGMDWQVNPQLRFNVDIGLLHTEIGQFKSAIAELGGKAFAKSPRYNISLASNWQFAPQWQLHADLRHVGSYYSEDENKPEFRITPFTVVNARLAYQASKDVELFFYGNNLLDLHHATWINKDARGNGLMANIVEPREIGIGINIKW